MYTPTGQPDKSELIHGYIPLVKRIAQHLLLRLPASVSLDDLIQNGMLGLLDALEKYQEGMGAQFETYATQRIRGAILDSLREADWLPRSLRKEMRRVEKAIQELEHTFGRIPSESEIADKLEISLPAYQKLLNDSRGHQLIYIEDLMPSGELDCSEIHLSSPSENPAQILEEKNLKEHLSKAIDRLPEREKLLMALYYEQELNLREIGEVLGVTESRVCQLHSQAISRLRAGVINISPAKKQV